MRSLIAVLAVWSLLAQPAEAQAAADRGRRLTLLVGPMLMTERDENASPLRYSGPAALFEIGYATRTDRRWLALRFGGAFGTLRSTLTQGNDLPRQATQRGWMEVEYVRMVGARNFRTSWFLGARLAARGTQMRHFYADPGRFDAPYAFLSAALGPILAAERASGANSTVRAKLAIGAIALIARPYSVWDLRLFPDPLHSRLVTLNALQAADLTVEYTAELHRAADLLISYRLVVERYRDARPFRFASQGVSVALALRLGGDQ